MGTQILQVFIFRLRKVVPYINDLSIGQVQMKHRNSHNPPNNPVSGHSCYSHLNIRGGLSR